MSKYTLMLLALATVACGTTDDKDETSDTDVEDTDGTDTEDDGTDTEDDGTDTEDDGTDTEDEMTDAEVLASLDLPAGFTASDVDTWLQAGSYSSWDAEGAPHVSTGPHAGSGDKDPGMVQTYVNQVLADSLAAGNTEHPVGATAVKETFDAKGVRNGWAMTVKTESDSADGDAWFWYNSASSVAAFGDDMSTDGCVGCHSAGDDYVSTPWPLQ